MNIGSVIGGIRNFIQIFILLIVVVILLKLFSLPSWDDWGDWVDYRIAVANIETKETPSFSRAVERRVWLLTSFGLRDRDKAIRLLCRLAHKGKEEAELLLLIYDMGMSECPDSTKLDK